MNKTTAEETLQKFVEIKILMRSLNNSLQSSDFKNVQWNAFRKEGVQIEEIQEKMNEVITDKFIDSQLS